MMEGKRQVTPCREMSFLTFLPQMAFYRRDFSVQLHSEISARTVLVRTVQRWEEFESLPVHRHEHAKAGTVYGYAEELGEWLESRTAPVARQGPSPRKKRSASRLIVLPFRLSAPR